ncbi:hypothetical protein D9619_001084 [Psilocybe cf. subviscida]|uniref:Uncharacterized protein n=1 Tax=Psilocybe cf. subviscida TaxID=2480587 RepID=A0A8H5F3J3_9AGAR|nr:hypothetical protein D9619_001084 [Psilocybe cf. subviscida]
MVLLSLSYALIRYCKDIAFFMTISFALLGLFLVYDVDRSHERSTIARIAQAAEIKEILADTHLKTIDTIDEGHSSFLLVFTPQMSRNDISAVGGGFSRLRAQSIKTVQALIKNRRLMAQKTAAIRARKNRIKRSNVALQSRRPNF